MKTLLQLFILLFAGTGTTVAQSSWFWQNPLPQGNFLRSVFFIDANTGMAVGDVGTIIKTTDGGITWSIQNSGTTVTLNQVIFTDANTGTVVGSSGTILRTTDGGENWLPQTSGTTLTLQGVSFSNASTAIVVGSSGTILKTTDGGTNWVSQTSGITQTLFKVSFTDLNNGTAVGASGRIVRTTDGGNNWVSQTSGTTQSLQGVSFTDANTGTAVGTGGTIRRTTDGGNNWISQTSGTTTALRNVFFTNTNNGIITGGGLILGTTDGGSNWDTLFVGGGELRDISFVGTNLAVVTGQVGIILKTTDGGQSWVELSSRVTGEVLWSVSFSDANNGIITGQTGTILRTTDGGNSWLTQISGTISHLYGVSSIDANTAFVVGHDGIILRTTNGGNNWVSQTSGTTNSLYGVSFIDANIGTAVGDAGTILRTTDGGTTWFSQTSGATDFLFQVFFTDANTGMAVGEVGTIIKTTDGGTTWVSQTSGTTNALFGIFFTDVNNGVAVGNSGTILRTTDGGTTWVSQTSGVTTHLKSVSFADANTGTVIGVTGTILRTTDGGTTWINELNGTTTNAALNSVSFVDANTGWTVGSNGAILKYSDDPPPPVNPNFGSNGQFGDNLYFFANSSLGASGAPSQPEFIWRDTTGSIDLYANGSNQAMGIFTGNNDDGRWSILNQLGGGNIKFFGTDYTDVYIGNNGIIGFNAFNQAFPNANQPPSSGLNQANVTEAIFPLWIDLNVGYTGVAGRRISYKVTGSELIVTFTKVPVYAPSSFTNDPDRYISFQVIIEFNNALPTENSRIFISYNNDETGALFITEYNAATLRTHLVGIQKNNDPEQFLQYRFSDASTVITQGPLFSSNLTLAMGADENTLPVELSSFTASVDKQDVYLNWTTVNEINNSGFEILRAQYTGDGENGNWVNIGFVDGNGTTNETKNYTFTDRGLNTGKYNYRLKQIDYNGNFEYFNLSNEVIIGVPDKYNLSQNYPNPFNPVTKINFDLPFDSRVTMKIFDITGREIATLVNDVQPAGYYTVTFDAKNIASGMYFYRIIAEGGNQNYVMTKKMVLLR